MFVEIEKGNEMLLADPIAKGWYDLLQGGKEEASQLALEISYASANNKLPEPITSPISQMVDHFKEREPFLSNYTLTHENVCLIDSL
ncbi:MAG: hypothetical protein E4H26_03975 [Flavobacteriales bacterium]|nr:MAG: hypothetical protein E4H26_03975 [Flavobacteriales bacterium]